MYSINYVKGRFLFYRFYIWLDLRLCDARVRFDVILNTMFSVRKMITGHKILATILTPYQYTVFSRFSFLFSSSATLFLSIFNFLSLIPPSFLLHSSATYLTHELSHRKPLTEPPLWDQSRLRDRGNQRRERIFNGVR